MPLHIHLPVQDPNHDDPGIGLPEIYDMGSDGIFQVTGPYIHRTPELPAGRKPLGRRNEITVVAVRLLQ